MDNKRKKKPEKAVKHRNRYTPDQREKAKKYYLLGLKMEEISLLTGNTPVRTLEKWQILDKWTVWEKKSNIKPKALQLHEGGMSYTQIADLLEISRPTVWRYLKEAKELKSNTYKK